MIKVPWRIQPDVDFLFGMSDAHRNEGS
jgi:hypothetical protein